MQETQAVNGITGKPHNLPHDPPLVPLAARGLTLRLMSLGLSNQRNVFAGNMLKALR